MTDPSNSSSSATGSTTIVYTNDLQGIKPPNFDWDSSELVQQFRSFRRYCELLLSTPTYASKTPKQIVNYILLWMGPQAVEVFDNWSHLTDDQKEVPENVWDAFSQYFEPKSNFRLARFQLRDLKQDNKESVDSFVNRLKVQAKKCNFKDASSFEDNLIDQFIKGISHVSVQKKLLDQDPKTLTLDKALDLARTFEATQSQLIQLGCTEQVNYVKQCSKKFPTNVSRKSSPQTCCFCGGPFHKRENCPARNQYCNKCRKIGHWGKMCMSKPKAGQSAKLGAFAPLAPCAQLFSRAMAQGASQAGHGCQSRRRHTMGAKKSAPIGARGAKDVAWHLQRLWRLWRLRKASLTVDNRCLKSQLVCITTVLPLTQTQRIR